jgi:hypothetical protein
MFTGTPARAVNAAMVSRSLSVIGNRQLAPAARSRSHCSVVLRSGAPPAARRPDAARPDPFGDRSAPRVPRVEADQRLVAVMEPRELGGTLRPEGHQVSLAVAEQRGRG